MPPCTSGLAVRFAKIQKKPAEWNHRIGRVIARLIVDPTVRRSGIGRQLLDRAVTDCRRRGLVPILDVLDRFTPAMTLYERAGWRRLGMLELELPDDGWIRLHVYVAPDASYSRSPTGH
ncbi:MAG: GNAT family N-acetyltransferase [Actinomycetota bacterium]